MEHYKFSQNRECEFFPCHDGLNKETFNCMFCYCPLYALGAKCGGNFEYLENGVKDCTNCRLPHIPENYDRIMEKMGDVIEIAKKHETSETNAPNRKIGK